MATTVQRMDKRLDRLVDLMKSCQLSRTVQKNLPLQRQFSFIGKACGMNGHNVSESGRSSYGNSSWVNQSFNNNQRTKITFLIEGTTISTLNVRKEAIEWEPIHSNLELSVVVIIRYIIIVV